MMIMALIVLMVGIPFAVLISGITVWRIWYKSRNRRSPLTTTLIHLPGGSLRYQLDDLNWEIAVCVALTFTVFSVPITIKALSAYYHHYPSLLNGDIWVFPISLIVLAWLVWRAITLINRRQKLLEGLQAEEAVAQELMPLLRDGCYLFHDVDAKLFNIDHVIVGPGGVYAVETKSRLKPNSGKDSAKVRYDGSILHFPDWSDTKIVEQARRQAKWLAEQLSRSTGSSTSVKAVVALPGWYVDVTGKSDVLVINPKNAGFFAKRNKDSLLTEARISQIVYQVEQLSCVNRT